MATVTTTPEKIGKMGIFALVQYACKYMCECGNPVLYLDENGKPDKLVKCWECQEK